MPDGPPAPPADAETGARALVRALDHAGIRTLFGIPGLHTLDLWDALADTPSIRTVVTRHEQAAAMAADGYARATGTPAAVLAITGPGATNTLTGVATAYVDSVPMLVLTGQVDQRHAGQDHETTHELREQHRLFEGVTGHSRTVTRADAAMGAVADAVVAMRQGRPRPVHLQVPTDVQAEPAEPRRWRARPIARPGVDDATLESLAAPMRAARRPVIYCGGGAVDAAGPIRDLARRWQAAVLTTPTARGVVPDDDDWALGSAWTKATQGGPIEDLLRSCDVMLALGASFGGNPTGGWTLPVPRTLLHVDIDPGVLGRHYRTAVAAHADVGSVVPRLTAALGTDQPERSGFAGDVRTAYAQVQAACAPATRAILDAIRDAVGRDGIVVGDVTVLAYAAGTYLRVLEPRTYLSPAKFGTLGFGLPAAIGAKIGRPDRDVVVLCGDGGLMLNLHELATAAQEALPLAILVHNNHGYGAIRHSQDRRFAGRRIGTDLHTPDLELLAQAFGVAYAHPATAADLGHAIRSAVRAAGPTLIEWTEDVPFPW
jgi:thiamine pyrophosphate-dependent acetolactate synthase large subunit-like protein